MPSYWGLNLANRADVRVVRTLILQWQSSQLELCVRTRVRSLGEPTFQFAPRFFLNCLSQSFNLFCALRARVSDPLFQIDCKLNSLHRRATVEYGEAASPNVSTKSAKMTLVEIFFKHRYFMSPLTSFFSTTVEILSSNACIQMNVIFQ